MTRFVITGASVYDGSGAEPFVADVHVAGGIIASVATPAADHANGPARTDGVERVAGRGLALAPGFIDAHTHDDLAVIASPDMTFKTTQGVTTVVVGNCGISAATGDFRDRDELPDPMVLLGPRAQFRYADFAAYAHAVHRAAPAVNVAALVGHTALRAIHMDRLDRDATEAERLAMRADLNAALDAGAFGLSTGLAYANANFASTAEVVSIAQALRGRSACYCTHLRSETSQIIAALEEAFAIGRDVGAPVVISHLKCAGTPQHGRSEQILALLEAAAADHPVGCDCYPYTASSSTLDLGQVVPETPIKITWSDGAPGQAGRMLSDIAVDWSSDLCTAAARLQPAGAVYHCMADEDVDRILSYRLTMVGSDGLPCDPRPHPRLWGSFPRVLGHYARDRALLSLPQAVRKMTGLTADRFGLHDRGYVRAGLAADLVLFDPATIADRATYESPCEPTAGITGVWTNGVRTIDSGGPTGKRGGRMLCRTDTKA